LLASLEGGDQYTRLDRVAAAGVLLNQHRSGSEVDARYRLRLNSSEVEYINGKRR
jgi:hypothetical protein